LESNPNPGFTPHEPKAQLTPIGFEGLRLDGLEGVLFLIIVEISCFDFIAVLPSMQGPLKKQQQQKTTQTFHGCFAS
jgi:hypothetical protein